jgi:ATF/CREB family transcription factor
MLSQAPNSSTQAAPSRKRARKDERPRASPRTRKNLKSKPEELDEDSDGYGSGRNGEDDEEGGYDGQKRGKLTDEQKRKSFLERNRVAALKCRQRKKQWLANLQAKVEYFSAESENLTNEVTALREQVASLKAVVEAHKNCPVQVPQDLMAAALGSDYVPMNTVNRGMSMVPMMPQAAMVTEPGMDMAAQQVGQVRPAGQGTGQAPAMSMGQGNYRTVWQMS